MVRSGLLLACVFVAVVAFCAGSPRGYYRDRHEASYEHRDHDGWHPGYYRERARERFGDDVSARDLIDAIDGLRERRHGSEEEHEEEEHAEEEEHHEEEHHDDHTWRFHVGHEKFGGYNYLDDNGRLKGFFVDLIGAVCEEAGKKCTYLIDDYEHCWRGHEGMEYPGIGLLSGWYDGCIGLSPTPDRLNAFNFTEAFTAKKPGTLYYRAGEHGEDLLSVKGLNVGFADGWASGERCLQRQHGVIGNHDGEYIGHHFKGPRKLLKALKSKQVDVVMTTAVLDEEKYGLVSPDRKFECTSGGLSVMTHHGSELIHWWNEAFHHLRDSGRLNRLCENSARAHSAHGHINCIH